MDIALDENPVTWEVYFQKFNTYSFLSKMYVLKLATDAVYYRLGE